MAFHATQNENVTLSGQTISQFSLECDAVELERAYHNDRIHPIITTLKTDLIHDNLFFRLIGFLSYKSMIYCESSWL